MKLQEMLNILEPGCVVYVAIDEDKEIIRPTMPETQKELDNLIDLIDDGIYCLMGYVPKDVLDKGYVECIDDWEDIKGSRKLEFGGDCKWRFIADNGVGYEFPKEIMDIINKLIENQEYLKERLDKYDL